MPSLQQSWHTGGFHAGSREKQREIIVLQIRVSEKQIMSLFFPMLHLENSLYQQNGITNM